ncbi:MAG: hypothetical protein HKN29_04900 [Rhodothermales bacterium]|nr:hypothetical protein [Rhodothermales bacterium]
MRYLVIFLVLIGLAGCDSGETVEAESELFGRWWTSSPRFGGLVVSSPASGSLGRTETEFLFQVNFTVRLDQEEDLVQLTFEQSLEGPRTDYVYNRDGSLNVRLTSNIKTMDDATVAHIYSGTPSSGATTLRLTNEDGRSLDMLLGEEAIELSFENYIGFFPAFTRQFFDYGSGSAQPTPFVQHFASDPYTVSLEYR